MLQNTSTTTNGSTSFYAVADNGYPGVLGSNYVNLGINGSKYKQAALYFGITNDSYLFPVGSVNGAPTGNGGGNFWIGTYNTNANVYFSVGIMGTAITCGVNSNGYFGNGIGLTNLPTSGVSNFLGSVTNVATTFTNNLGNSVAVTMTNAANRFTGVLTNSTYYGNGIGLTNIPVSAISGLSSSNGLAAAAFTVGVSPVSLTNTFGKGIEVFLWGGVLQSVSLNSGSLMTNVSTICLQTNEYITVTYTGTIQAQWHPFP